jgi:hypothetical protein
MDSWRGMEAQKQGGVGASLLCMVVGNVFNPEGGYGNTTSQKI